MTVSAAPESLLDRALVARALTYCHTESRVLWADRPVAEVAEIIRARQLWFAVPDDLKDLARNDLDILAALGGRLVTREDPEWPRSLTRLDDTAQPGPFGLYVRGPARLDAVGGGAVTVLGSRTPTGYGRTVTTALVGDLARLGWTIAATSAYGVAALAHRTALAEAASPVAVMPGGLGTPHPPGNAALLAAVAERGAVVSEYPPGTSVTRARRRAHTRLFPVLSRAVVVVESAPGGEAAATVAAAERLATPVFAVPGPITSATAALPHQLISDGRARLVTHARDIHRYLH